MVFYTCTSILCKKAAWLNIKLLINKFLHRSLMYIWLSYLPSFISFLGVMHEYQHSQFDSSRSWLKIYIILSFSLHPPLQAQHLCLSYYPLNVIQSDWYQMWNINSYIHGLFFQWIILSKNCTVNLVQHILCKWLEIVIRTSCRLYIIR